jgi:hypothetical protein
MINSLPPSIFPTNNSAIVPNEQPPAGQLGEKSGSLTVAATTTTRSQDIFSHRSRGSDESREARHARHGDQSHHSHGRSERSEGRHLFRAAKHMIKDAFRDFRHDIRESFGNLGFDRGMAKQIAKNVVHATRDALRSGADFSAKLMVAAFSQTSTAGASSFSMVASSIEVSINHATGSIDVNTTKVSIEGQFNNQPGGTQPHLLDIRDSDEGETPDLTGALLGPQDLDGILEGEEDGTETAPALVEPTLVTTAREQVDNSLGQAVGETEPEVSTRTAVESVLKDAETEEAAPTEEAEKTEAEEAREASEEVADAAEEAELNLPEILAPLLLSQPEFSARIFITAFEQFRNDREERITVIRFDAVIPLTGKPAEPVEETPVVETPVLEEPLADEPASTAA